jgi:uncharacterized protein (TIRG00374 family)
MKRQYPAFIVLIISVLFFIFFLLPAFNLREFVESLKNINLFLFLLALIAVLVSNVILSVRWSLLMREVKAQNAQRFINAFGFFFLGQATGLFVPSRVGSYAKVPLIMKSDNISYKTGLSAVNAETIFDLAYLCGAGIVSFFIMSRFFSTYPIIFTVLNPLILVFLIGAFISLVFFQHILLLGKGLNTLSQDYEQIWIIRAFARFLGRMFELAESTRDFFQNRFLILGLGTTTLIGQFIGAISLFLIILSTREMVPFPEVFALLIVSYIIGIVSLIPGGFGASDISLIVLLSMEGIPTAVGTNIAILWRLAMYLPIFLGIGMYFILQKFPMKKLFYDTN